MWQAAVRGKRSIKDKPVPAGVSVAATGLLVAVAIGVSSLVTYVLAAHPEAFWAKQTEEPAVVRLAPSASNLEKEFSHQALVSEPYQLRKISLAPEFGSLQFFMVDNSDKGSDNIIEFLMQHEQHVMGAFFTALDTEACKRSSARSKNMGHFLGECLSPGGDKKVWFADVGSNSGFYGRMAGALGYPVLSIDPQPHCVQYVRAAAIASGQGESTVALAAFAGEEVRASHSAVPQRTGCWGTFPVVEPEHEMRLEQSMAKATGWKDKVDVPMLLLDDVVLGEAGLGEDLVLGAVKIDVEGSERGMLRGAARLLREGRIYHIVIELNKPQWKNSGVSHEQAVDMLMGLAAYGYQCKLSTYGPWEAQEAFDMSRPRLEKLMQEGWLTVDMWCSLLMNKRHHVPNSNLRSA